MLYKTVGLAAVSAVCALMVGCANTTTGKMVEPLEVMPTEVCIIQNPKVTIGEAIPSLQSAFQRRGIKTTVVRDAASCTSEYRLSYVMQRSWDATTYLGLAELTLYKKRRHRVDRQVQGRKHDAHEVGQDRRENRQDGRQIAR